MTLAKRNVVRRLAPPRVVRPVRELRRTLELIGRRPRNNVDDAGIRVAAVERALRALQDLNPFDVKHVREHLTRLGLKHAIEVDAYRRFIAREAADAIDATDADQRTVEPVVAKHKARHLILKLRRAVDAFLVEPVAR